jgi:UDP-N-acetylenolpyruvoylglucosamine reductase
MSQCRRSVRVLGWASSFELHVRETLKLGYVHSNFKYSTMALALGLSISSTTEKGEHTLVELKFFKCSK